MISFLKRLWRDPRGNALLIAGAALPLVVGSAGLASDTIQWALWKRQLQRAADSAALAGVYAKFNAETVSSSVDTDLARNNHTYAALTGAPQLAYPANSATYINAVQVTLSVQKTAGLLVDVSFRGPDDHRVGNGRRSVHRTRFAQSVFPVRRQSR